MVERILWRHAADHSPEARLIVAVFGQAFVDSYSTNEQDDPKQARYWFTSVHAVELAGLIGLDYAVIRALRASAQDAMES